MSEHCREGHNKEHPEPEWKVVKVIRCNTNERFTTSPDSEGRMKIVIEKKLDS